MDFVKSLGHPEEIYNLIRFKMFGCQAVKSKVDQDSMSEDLQTCYKYLGETARSFATTINALEGELRDAACILYLFMRAVDTIEDDMTISLETKLPILKNFHNFIHQPDWRFTGSKHKCRQLLEDFPTITREFRNLPKVYQEVIVHAIYKTAQGMAEYLQKEVESVHDWDSYCDQVSSVATGLLRMFSASELEDPIIGEDTRLSVSLGLFIQKVNNIRDYLEDELDGREFWPKEVWSKYANKLSDFTKPENIVPAIQCLNELITNSLQHVPDVLLYLSRLRNQNIFNFSAIPMMMGMATLATCYNNQQVFQKSVKIRRGQVATMMMNATNMGAVRTITCQYVQEFYRKIPPTDPSSEQTRDILATIKKLSTPNDALVSRSSFTPIYLSCAGVLATLSWHYLRPLLDSQELHKGY